MRHADGAERRPHVGYWEGVGYWEDCRAWGWGAAREQAEEGGEQAAKQGFHDEHGERDPGRGARGRAG